MTLILYRRERTVNSRTHYRLRNRSVASGCSPAIDCWHLGQAGSDQPWRSALVVTLPLLPIPFPNECSSSDRVNRLSCMPCLKGGSKILVSTDELFV